ncbi:MAG: hypothetical protein M0Z41_08255 [Peptococcaceae bacterium]|nr:hypothetical protein [Peptococcaceae bacterium]
MRLRHRWFLLLPVAIVLIFVAGCGTSASSPSTGAATTQPGKGFTVLGLAPGPLSGPGAGTIFIGRNGDHFRSVVYVRGANSFLPATTPGGHRAFVATEAGKTYVLSLPDGGVKSSFATPAGGRLAVVSPGGGHVYVIGGSFTAAYDTAAPYRLVALLKQGGNALVISPGGHHGYLAGNFRSNILKLNLPGLTVAATAGVGGTGDLAISPDGKRLWAADMFNGNLYVVDTAAMRLVHTISTPEGDPAINLHNLMAATAGFMQLSMNHSGKRLYAAGFSGHVLVFDTSTYKYTSLAIKVPPGKSPAMGGTSAPAATPAPPKLSGLVVLPSGRRMIATAENYKTTLLLSTRTGRTLATYPGVASNRWIVVG